jgi:pimeloyl-ACP methyl ester carboxylesterase
MSNDASSVLLDGPWEHRFITANGARFHVAEIGEGPLVVLLHGFPQFWWAWRDQLVALSQAGYHVAAIDLRGYGASDKPPRGYDTFTLAADVASIVRSLGEGSAAIIGHGWGGWIAWSMPTMQPAVTRAIGALGMPHPLVLRHASAPGRPPAGCGLRTTWPCGMPRRWPCRSSPTPPRSTTAGWSAASGDSTAGGSPAA